MLSEFNCVKLFRHFLLIIVIAVLTPIHVNSMEFKVSSFPIGNKSLTAISARGNIVSGDTQRFMMTVRSNPTLPRILAITSGGGDVEEAYSLARAIKETGFSVVVIEECASACSAIIFPAGEYSILSEGSLLGFHSCYLSLTLEIATWCNKEIAEVAVKNGFPHGAISYFMDAIGPYEMRWMSKISATCFGYYRGIGDPKPIHARKACVEGLLAAGLQVSKERQLGPSFDCRKAIEKIELLLCLDKELMMMDRIMGELYVVLMKLYGRVDMLNLRERQRQWISHRDQKCLSLIEGGLSYRETRVAADCISENTQSRILELVDLKYRR